MCWKCQEFAKNTESSCEHCILHTLESNQTIRVNEEISITLMLWPLVDKYFTSVSLSLPSSHKLREYVMRFQTISMFLHWVMAMVVKKREKSLTQSIPSHRLKASQLVFNWPSLVDIFTERISLLKTIHTVWLFDKADVIISFVDPFKIQLEEWNHLMFFYNDAHIFEVVCVFCGQTFENKSKLSYTERNYQVTNN